MEEVLGIVAPVPKGDWNNLTAYEQLNIVRHNNTLYMAKQNVPTDVEPTVSANWADYWVLLMSPLSATDIVEQVYPVGSLYISANSTDPAITYGGTWEQITDCFILAASEVSAENPTYEGGDTGGQATITLTEQNMPVHAHDIPYAGGGNTTITKKWSIGLMTARSQGLVNIINVEGTGTAQDTTYPDLNQYYCAGTQDAGGNTPFNNLPPYLAVYVWKRIA